MDRNREGGRRLHWSGAGNETMESQGRAMAVEGPFMFYDIATNMSVTMAKTLPPIRRWR